MRPSFPRMAGHHSIHVDPALNRYANMYVKRHEFFRWTPRTAGITVFYVLAVPSAFLYMAYATEGKYELRGKWRGDVLKEF